MNVQRIAIIVVAGGALAAWLAAASTAGRRPHVAVVARTTTPVEMRGAELAAEIARLRDRLRPSATPQTPARNLFEFSRTTTPPRAAGVGVAAPAAVEVPAPVIATPPLKLVGIAEDVGPDGAVRTAIISSLGQLFFAKPGEQVTERYQVVKISSEAAELTDLHDHSTVTLALK
jgi:hypothetical protein